MENEETNSLSGMLKTMSPKTANLIAISWKRAAEKIGCKSIARASLEQMQEITKIVFEELDKEDEG